MEENAVAHVCDLKFKRNWLWYNYHIDPITQKFL